MVNRRDMMGHSALAVALFSTGLLSTQALAFNADAFKAKSIADALKAYGASEPEESAEVRITAPDIAENGAVVPIGAATSLTGVKQVLLMVEKNPSVLAASFMVNDKIEPNFQTRVKMGQSSDVYAIAIMKDGKVLYAKKETKVTLGGCGG